MKTKSVRLPDELAVELARYQRENGGSSSQIMRQSLRAFFDSAPAPKKMEYFGQRLEKFRQDMARVGGNLNQTAHYFNMYDDIIPDDLEANHAELKIEFRRIAELLNEIQHALNRKHG